MSTSRDENDAFLVKRATLRGPGWGRPSAPAAGCVEVRKMNGAGVFQRFCIEHQHWLEEADCAVSVLDREIERLKAEGLYREPAARARPFPDHGKPRKPVKQL